MSKRYTIPVQVDESDNPFITFPEELIEELGWIEGDVLEWSEDIDGTILLKKIRGTLRQKNSEKIRVGIYEY